MLQVGRVPETLKVREHIDLFSSYYPEPLPLEETLKIAGLNDIKDRPYGELSGGQKQRVLFGIAICGDPDLLFLDEPTVGLDVEARRLMWSQIRTLIARGKTVLLTTHYLNEADALADRILVLDKGAIVAEGTPAEIKARAMGKQIRCTSRLSLEEVRQIPGVLSVKADRNAFELQVNAAEPVVRELLQRDSLAGRSGSHQRRAGRGVPGADAEPQRRARRRRTNMAATTFPAALAVTAPLAGAHHRALSSRKRSTSC